MQKLLCGRFQGMLACIVVLCVLILMTACGDTGTSTGAGAGQATTPTRQTTTGTTTTTAPPTQVPATATQPAAAPTTAVPFKAGGISFIGAVKSVNNGSLVMSAPDGQTYTMAITAQTDRSALGGSLPTVGASINMDSTINTDGSLAATILKPAQQGDPDLSVIAYTGITASAVGADRVIHFTAGTKNYTYTIPTTAVLSDFGGNAQAIGANVSVKVKVQYPANAVVSIGNASA